MHQDVKFIDHTSLRSPFSYKIAVRLVSAISGVTLVSVQAAGCFLFRPQALDTLPFGLELKTLD